MKRFLLEFLWLFFLYVEVSLCKSIFDLDDDFKDDSKEDLLLYFVAIQQKIISRKPFSTRKVLQRLF